MTTPYQPPNPYQPKPGPFQVQRGSRNAAIVVGLLSVFTVAAVALVAILAIKASSRSNERNQAAASSSSAAAQSISTTTSAVAPLRRSGTLPPFTPPADLGADCQYPAADPAARKVDPPRSGQVSTEPPQINTSMTTSQGDIGLVLDNGKAPCTVNSFVSLAKQGYFDNTVCHRMTTGGLSVLQCGDPTGSGTGGPGYQFANEYPTNQYAPDDPAATAPVLYPAGTLAMANAGPGTNGSQFFMVYRDSLLPPQYTVFGTIDQAGTDTLAKIAHNGIAAGAPDGKPAQEVKIIGVRID